MGEPQSAVSFDFVHQDERATVRTIMRAGVPWFVAADVCAVLGLKNPSDVIAKSVAPHQTALDLIYTVGGARTVNLVSEGGLYRLVFRSRKPAAVAFTDWVTDQVLPALRRGDAPGRPRETPDYVYRSRYLQQRGGLSAAKPYLHDHYLRVLAAAEAMLDRGRPIDEESVAVVSAVVRLGEPATLRALRFLVFAGYFDAPADEIAVTAALGGSGDDDGEDA